MNLGSGPRPLSGWVNVDRFEPCDVLRELDTADWSGQPLTLAESVDEFFASHLLEHIVRIEELLAECWRVAKPGARFVARVPYGSSDDADEDPGHVRRFFRGSWGYFGQPYRWRGGGVYAADWQVRHVWLVAPGYPSLAEIDRGRNLVDEMVAEMVAVKPARARDRGLIEHPQVSVTDR